MNLNHCVFFPVPQELKIIKKEHFNRWYKLGTFYAAFLAADMPIQVKLTDLQRHLFLISVITF